MTILSDLTIDRLVRETGMIQPYRDVKIIHEESGLSYGLQPCAYDLRIRYNLLLPAGGFSLASTIEAVNMPRNVCAFVHDKSTWARRGIAVQNTHVDPGFRGHLTIELTNHGRDPVYVAAGTPICQLVFHLIDREVLRSYTGKYQDQPDRPVRALKEGERP